MGYGIRFRTIFGMGLSIKLRILMSSIFRLIAGPPSTLWKPVFEQEVGAVSLPDPAQTGPHGHTGRLSRLGQGAAALDVSDQMRPIDRF